MINSTSSISYNEARIYLKPEYVACEEFRKECVFGVLNMNSGNFVMTLENCFLEMDGIATSPLRRVSLNSKTAIIRSIEKIIGNIKPQLKECRKLANKKIINDELYFTQLGLADNSIAEKFEGKRIFEWIHEAKKNSFEPEKYLPKNFILPENLEVEFTCEYQKLIDLEIELKKSRGDFFVTGKTFAESVNNFLAAYDVVSEYLVDVKQKRKRT